MSKWTQQKRREGLIFSFAGYWIKSSDSTIPEKYYCGSCDNEFRVSNEWPKFRGSDFAPLCDECFGDRHTNCSNCHTTYRSEEGAVAWRVPAGEETIDGSTSGNSTSVTLCPSCFASHTRDCPDCSRRVFTENTRRGLEILRVCNSCWGERYVACTQCRGTIDRELTAGRSICRRCYNTHVILRYSSKSSQILGFVGDPETEFVRKDMFRKKEEEPTGLWVGWEIECEIHRDKDRYEVARRVRDRIGELAIIKEDSTLTHGFEISSAPMSFAHHKSGIWETLFSREGKRYMRSGQTNTCGMHIHVTRDALTDLQIGKMLGFIHNRSHRNFIEYIAQRNSESYGRISVNKKIVMAKEHPLTIRRIELLDSVLAGDDVEIRATSTKALAPKMKVQVQDAYGWGRPITVRKVIDDRTFMVDHVDADLVAGSTISRYFGEGTAHNRRADAMNVTNNTTIEFRMFRGTLYKEYFYKNIEFVHALVKFTGPAVHSIDESQNVMCFKDFVAKRKDVYPNLVKFMGKENE